MYHYSKFLIVRYFNIIVLPLRADVRVLLLNNFIVALTLCCKRIYHLAKKITDADVTVTDQLLYVLL